MCICTSSVCMRVCVCMGIYIYTYMYTCRRLVHARDRLGHLNLNPKPYTTNPKPAAALYTPGIA